MTTQKQSTKENLIQVAKFVAFSLGAGIIQTLTFTLLNETWKLDYWLAYLPALILSVLYNFTVNRRFTFKSANNIPVAMLKVAGYYLVFTPLSTWAGNLVSGAYPDFPLIEYIILAVTMLTNLTTEFLFCRFVVYGKSINTNSLAKKQTKNQQAPYDSAEIKK